MSTIAARGTCLWPGWLIREFLDEGLIGASKSANRHQGTGLLRIIQVLIDFNPLLNYLVMVGAQMWHNLDKKKERVHGNVRHTLIELESGSVPDFQASSGSPASVGVLVKEPIWSHSAVLMTAYWHHFSNSKTTSKPFIWSHLIWSLGKRAHAYVPDSGKTRL